ncbi:hypothetical protein ABG79_00219 [Caloramator mitchellensis]|uniref:Uncharacterized protein n=2 Tax=Caloramator mitchellensis TaxID=908809 RepID=A0A0R3K3Q9_CALMK|nr:hypothetical protein ABG79_00219 [Caloramator mitchellensis]
MDDWNAKGINISKEINAFNHRCPLTKAFLVDFDKITKQLKNIENMPGMEKSIVPNSKEMKEAMDFLKENNKNKIYIPNQGNTNGLSTLNAINTITKAMTPGNKISNGSATLKIRVNAVYTKYYGE